MENAIEKPTICVAGVGAIGGLLAALIGHGDVGTLSVIARGARKDALQKNGVILESDLFGHICAHPAAVAENGAALGVQDYVLLCVKNYSLDAIAEAVAPCVGAHTVLLPVMNGIEAGDFLRRRFPKAIVGDSVIYTITAALPDFSARQEGAHTYMKMGSQSPKAEAREKVKALAALLRDAGLDCRWADDVTSAIWQKYILNCAFNSITARYQTDVAGIRADAAKAADFQALLAEAYAVGEAVGVALPKNLVEKSCRAMREKQAPTATSSMKRDIAAHRPTELDAFLGALLQKAEEAGVAVPVSRRYYDELKAMTERP
ncbi:MAG: ketopantoate reductase family protein [Schwartzia sp. (in: firmicutes)]